MPWSRRFHNSRPLIRRFVVGVVLVAYLIAATILPVPVLANPQGVSAKSCCCGSACDGKCGCGKTIEPAPNPEPVVPSCCAHKKAPSTPVVLIAAGSLRCQGVNLFVAGGSLAVTPPPPVTWSPALTSLDSLLHADESATAVLCAPLSPPPRS